MSYILEALRKSEQDRRVGHTPELDVVQQADRPRRKRWLVPVLLVSLLLLANAVLLYLLFGQAPVEPTRQTEMAAADPVPRADSVAKPRPVAPQQAAALPVAPPPTQQAPPADRPAAVIDAPLPPPPAVTAPPPPPTPVKKVEPASKRDQYAALPLWRELSPADRQGLPDLKLDVHVYAAEVSRRFVLINLKKFREREELPEGPRVEAITVDGVVLRYRGKSFKLTSQ